MRKILCAVTILVVTVSGRSLDEVLGSMDKQIGLYGKQLTSQIPNLSDPFHNWFLSADETQQDPQNIAALNQQVQIPKKSQFEDPAASDQLQSYQSNPNAPPSWMTQNQNNNIPSWMINPPQNHPSFQRTTTQRPSWNQNVNSQPTQRPNTTQRPSSTQRPPQNNQQQQNLPQGPVQQQFTVPPVQNTQNPIINHQTQAPVGQNTVPSWMVPTSQPNLGNQQNLNNHQGLVNQPGQSNQPGHVNQQVSPNVPIPNQPGQNNQQNNINQQYPTNQPNLNNQVIPNQQVPVTPSPNLENSQLPHLNQQTQAPNQRITAPVIQNTQPSLINQQTQPVQVTNPTQPQFTAPVIQNTTPINLIQQTQAPNIHMTAPVIQNTQRPTQPSPIDQNVPISSIWEQTQAPEVVTQPENQNSIPSWVMPTQQPINLLDVTPQTPNPTSHPIFTAPVFSRTQQQQILPSTQSPWIPVAPQIIDDQVPINPQFPTAPSVTNSPNRFPTAPVRTMIPQFPSLNLVTMPTENLQQPWLNQLQNNQNLLEIEQSSQQHLGVQQVINSQGVAFPSFTAPVIRMTQPPTNSRQNQLPPLNYQFTAPIITRSTTTNFPRVQIVTRPNMPIATTARPLAMTTRPHITPVSPIIPTLPPTTTTRNPLFPIIPHTTTRQPQMTFFPPAVTTRPPNVLQTTTRHPLIPIIPQVTTRPPAATTRPTAPTIRPPVTTPRPQQPATRVPLATARPTTTQRPRKTTTKEVSRTTSTPEIRQPSRNQQSINDIMKMTDDILSSLNNQIWQSISRVG